MKISEAQIKAHGDLPVVASTSFAKKTFPTNG
jgi:hypothetical protein